MKKYAPFNEVKSLRTSLGLTQQQLANYLGANLSSVAMAELDKRQLPPQASLNFTNLQLAAMQPGEISVPVAANKKQEAAAKKELQYYAADCRRQATVLQEKLLAMQQRYTAAENMLRLLPWLRGKLPVGKEGDNQRRWLASFETYANETLPANSAPAQQLLQLKLAHYNAAAEEAEGAAALYG